MSRYPNVVGVNYESVVDGAGVRTVIYFAGCSHNCPGCQNADAQNPTVGQECTKELIQDIANEIRKRKFLKGITLSGGDPLFNPEKTLNFIQDLSEELREDFNKLDVWVYTGYTWEEIMNKDNEDLNLLFHIVNVSVLVDGPFIQTQADKRLRFRGSRNQRLIDVQKSLRNEDRIPAIWKGKNK